MNTELKIKCSNENEYKNEIKCRNEYIYIFRNENECKNDNDGRVSGVPINAMNAVLVE